ncbi:MULTISPECIES: zinc-binding dehydrogenase [unclassified Streptomyces]|uniref:zinc-binding dehydrogenase n=1 Tax=unclassified Streptomyces TaxID=2593676 RepID=UPI0003631EF6|nr:MULTISPECIES: zinc-binding dehydrogenase [unclassified Streptomyces]MYT32702.1 zinc-binding dehydrogenase [Streptomyces sp. SID8354]
MRAIRLHTFGPAENLVCETLDDPTPGPGEVRIAVAAAGVHLLDTALREGVEGGPAPLPELPTVPGREVAGTVDAIGKGTDPAWLGRPVVAHLGMVPGGYAERAVTTTDRLHAIPDGLDAAQAVAMIGTGRTTLGILLFAALTPDDIAIVPAAAGGIGSLLVQHAKNTGATVIGLAGGPAKVAHVHGLGADLALDYTDDNWPARARRFLDEHGAPGATIVFDSVGGTPGRAAVDLLARGGRHLVFGWSSGGPLKFTAAELAERGITSESVLGAPMLARVGGINPLRTLETAALTEAAAGRLVPTVQRFPLAEAAAAHRALESRGTMGKVVLVP